MPWARPAARTIHSPASLVSPYGLTGAHGVSSVTRFTSGIPYTAADEENRNARTPLSAAASSSVPSPWTFSR